MTMTVELGALEAVVERLVKEGRYGSKSEVLRTGVRMVEEREAKLAELKALLQVGLDDIAAGRVHDAEDVFREIEDRRRKRDPA